LPDDASREGEQRRGKKMEARRRRRRRRLEPRRTGGERTRYHVGEGAHDREEKGVLGIE
jgi:hypothetical protein